MKLRESENIGWNIFAKQSCELLESAKKSGKTKYKLVEVDRTFECDLVTMSLEGGSESTQRLRRHIMKEGVQGMWEILSFRYEPPTSLSGLGFLKILNMIWKKGEKTIIYIYDTLIYLNKVIRKTERFRV